MVYLGDEARAKWICKMEHIIAKHCSTDSYIIGQYRYPVHYSRNGRYYKTDGLAKVEFDDIDTMYYKFGAHRLDIGSALLELIDYIDDNLTDIYGSMSSYGEDE